MAPQRKTALITGCSDGGIGGALAEAFHDKGYHVFATARTPSKISQALSSSPNVTVLSLDVLSGDSIAAAARSVETETGGTLDVLVNNSGGGGMYLPALDIPIEEGKKLFDLNFWAQLAMVQAFAPLLINGKGCIVNNTSGNAHIPIPLMSLYSASKAALASASETWRQELQPLGVRTVTLVTCAVKTKFFENYQPAELPETSRYYDVKDLIRGITDGRLQDKAISARQYADKVVGIVDGGAVGPVWAGTDAFFNRLAVWLSPRWLLDMVLESMIPLSGEMAKAAARNKKA